MKSKFNFLIVLVILTGCFQRLKKYPLNTVSLNNYEEPDFKYKKLNTLQYEFCGKWILFYYKVPEWENIEIMALQKFFEDNQLSEDRAIINITNRQGKYFVFPPFYLKNCRIVEMDLVQKIKENNND